MSPFSAVGMLVSFRNRKLQMSTEYFDECQQALIQLLEDCNDEKHRLFGPITDEPLSQEERHE